MHSKRIEILLGESYKPRHCCNQKDHEADHRADTSKGTTLGRVSEGVHNVVKLSTPVSLHARPP